MRVSENERKTYPIQEVLMGDETGLSPQGNHACLDANCFALRSIEVICAPDSDQQLNTMLDNKS